MKIYDTEEREKCEKTVPSIMSRPTITFNINKITKYERPAGGGGAPTHFYISRPRPTRSLAKIYFLSSHSPTKPFVCILNSFSTKWMKYSVVVLLLQSLIIAGTFLCKINSEYIASSLVEAVLANLATLRAS